MNVAVPLLITLPFFLFGSFYYARRINKTFAVNDDNVTPAITCCDDRYFVPTRSFVLFGHHFATIAGGGPSNHSRGRLCSTFYSMFSGIRFGTGLLRQPPSLKLRRVQRVFR